MGTSTDEDNHSRLPHMIELVDEQKSPQHGTPGGRPSHLQGSDRTIPVQGDHCWRSATTWLPSRRRKAPTHLPFDLPGPGIGLGPYVEGPGLGRMALFPDLHSPLIRTAFLDRSVPKIQIQENYFGEDLPRMACNMVGTGGFEPPTSTVSR